MKIVKKIGLLPEAHWHQPGNPQRIVLHDTAGPTLKGAEDTLKQRRLGYHAMIDRDGTIYQYYEWDDAVNHAFANNRLTIGVSLVGGGGTSLKSIQIDATVELLQFLKARFSSIKSFTSHKECDPRGEKIDPEFHPFEATMNDISNRCGLSRS